MESNKSGTKKKEKIKNRAAWYSFEWEQKKKENENKDLTNEMKTNTTTKKSFVSNDFCFQLDLYTPVQGQKR